MKKLNPAPPRERNHERIGLSSRSQSTKMIHVGLSPDEAASLNNTLKKVNEFSKRKVKKSQIIRALIQMGSTADPNKILDALRDTI